MLAVCARTSNDVDARRRGKSDRSERCSFPDRLDRSNGGHLLNLLQHHMHLDMVEGLLSSNCFDRLRVCGTPPIHTCGLRVLPAAPPCLVSAWSLRGATPHETGCTLHGWISDANVCKTGCCYIVRIGPYHDRMRIEGSGIPVCKSTVTVHIRLRTSHALAFNARCPPIRLYSSRCYRAQSGHWLL